MQKTRLTSLLLFAFMVFSLFAAGCDKDTGENSSRERETTTEKTTTTSQTTTAQTTTAVTTTEEKKETLPPLPDNFTLLTTNGMSFCDIHLNQDGTFTGVYHQQDHSTIENYSEIGEIRCEFKGNFKDIEQIDNFKYSMKFDNIESTAPPGERIADGVHTTFLDANSEKPSGFGAADSFTLYLPGTKKIALCDELLAYLYDFDVDLYNGAEEISYFVLYNHSGDTGFFTEKVAYDPAESTYDTSDKTNLINTMSSEEIVKLNKFFEPFSGYTTINLSDVKTPEDVFSFGIWQNHFNSDTSKSDSFIIPELFVEETIKRYFNIDTVDHKSVGDNGEFALPSYKDGYYSFGGDFGVMWTDWYNVYSFKKNSDGTYTAKLHYYYWDEITNENYDDAELPGNYYDRIDRWDMGDFAVVENINNTDTYSNPYAIEILSDDTVILSPYTVDGEESWRIESINGFEIPKNLSCE